MPSISLLVVTLYFVIRLRAYVTDGSCHDLKLGLAMLDAAPMLEAAASAIVMTSPNDFDDTGSQLFHGATLQDF